VKHHSDIGWNSEPAAVNAMPHQLEKVIAALQQLYDTPTEVLDTYDDVAVILNGTAN
jgi:hypothetical protein